MKTVRETGGSILSSAQQLSLSRDAVTMSVVDDHDETVSRNVICCLLALEIAEYDARPVFDQIRSTQDFRKLLADATANACPDDLVSIVHEDGALLSFLADPEQCFATALEIREAASTQDGYRDLPLRIGINLGMVEIAEDEFGHLYVSGQGRQDADRIMRHGPPRQISVARPFFELLSRVAPRLSGLLEYEGVFSDTLGPPLSLYRLPPPHGVRPDHRPVQVGASGSAPGALAPIAESTPVPPAESVQLPVTGRHWLRPAWLRNSLLPLLIGAVLLTPFSRSRVEVTAPGQAAGISAQEAAFVAAVVAPAPADTGEILEPAAESPKLPSTEPQTPLTSAPKRIATSPRSLTQKAKATTKAVTKAGSERAESATLVLAVKPWGEVYVDGKWVGITPPLKRFQVAPGRRQITVTNSSLPSYRMEATLNPAGQITVAHDFSCVSHREKPCRDEFGKGLELRSRFVAVSDENQR
jgi:hypothetical protein